MKKSYEMPVYEIIVLSSENILTESGGETKAYDNDGNVGGLFN